MLPAMTPWPLRRNRRNPSCAQPVVAEVFLVEIFAGCGGGGQPITIESGLSLASRLVEQHPEELVRLLAFSARRLEEAAEDAVILLSVWGASAWNDL